MKRLDLSKLGFGSTSLSSSFLTKSSCMSAFAANSQEIDEHKRHRVFPVPVGDSRIAFFLFFFLNFS